jgi:nucleoside-diphosphate-sugar epimerase
MKITVTGGAGFIGKRLVERMLGLGHEVTCLVRNNPRKEALEKLGATLVPGDVTAPESLPKAVAGAEVVFHLAGVTKAFSRQEFFRVNVDGSRNVAQACAAQPNPPVLVQVSSLAAAGPAPAERPSREADSPCPVSRYGESKCKAEEAVLESAAKAPITIVRPPIVFGPGDRDALEWYRSVTKGVHIVPSLTERRYSLIHVDDLVTGLWLAATRGSRAVGKAVTPEASNRGCYYIASGEMPTYAELGRLVAESLQRHGVRVVRVPELVGWAVAAISETAARLRQKPAILNLDKLREATAGSWICDASRARSELGFEPGATLQQRLAETGRWYREAGWLR